MDNQKSNNIISSNDLIWLLNAILKNWYLFLVIVPIFSLFGLIYNHKQVKKFNTKIEILLKSNDVYDYQENLYNNLGFYNYYGDISNQRRILGSYDMMQKVMSRLDLSCSYFIVGRLNTKEFFDELPFKVNAKVFNSSLYELPINFKILDNKRYELSYTLNEKNIKQIHHFDSLETTTSYSIITKLNAVLNTERANNLSEINYQIIMHNDNYWVNRIISNLSISNIEYTSLLVINLLDEIPERSKMVLDTLASQYIQYTLENQFRINQNTMTYINFQIEDVVYMIDSIQFELQNMRDKKGILDVDKESEKYFQSLMQHEASKRKIKLKIKSLENLKFYLSKVDDENILPPSLYVMSDDQYLSNSIKNFYENQLKKMDMTHGFKTGHQELEKMNEKIINQRKDILIYIQNTISALSSEILVEESEINYYKSLVKKIPLTERDLASVRRKLEVNEKLYEFLLEKRANTYISKSGIVPQTKIIEKARTVELLGKDNMKVIIFISGFFVALILAIANRLFFEKISQLKELSDLTKIPVLGGLPYLKTLIQSYIKIKSKENFVESLRALDFYEFFIE